MQQSYEAAREEWFSKDRSGFDPSIANGSDAQLAEWRLWKRAGSPPVAKAVVEEKPDKPTIAVFDAAWWELHWHDIDQRIAEHISEFEEKSLDAELASQLEALRSEIKTQIDQVRNDLQAELASLRQAIENMRGLHEQ
jgi:hypothetical protein